ncbi:MAG: T9SS type A sorting domain-containing protein, partial [Saprospiraceae bacterium]|nr:T9SS type A sorting domain-containing protein [Saprospiraceae bacterium]
MILRLKAEQSGKLSEMISIDNSFLNSEAYTGSDITPTDIQISVAGAKDLSPILYQNTPNPWRGETTIGFDLPESGSVKLTVSDITGRIIINRTIQGMKGANHITLNKSEMGLSSGVLMYKIEFGGQTFVKKMIVVE